MDSVCLHICSAAAWSRCSSETDVPFSRLGMKAQFRSIPHSSRQSTPCMAESVLEWTLNSPPVVKKAPDGSLNPPRLLRVKSRLSIKATEVTSALFSTQTLGVSLLIQSYQTRNMMKSSSSHVQSKNYKPIFCSSLLLLTNWNIFRFSGVLQMSIVKMWSAVASHIPKQLRLEPELKDFT